MFRRERREADCRGLHRRRLDHVGEAPRRSVRRLGPARHGDPPGPLLPPVITEPTIDCVLRTPQPYRLRKNNVIITASRRPTTNTSLGCGQPFDRRTLLRGVGALGAASVALLPTACSSDDDALTFFFAANPEEADARLRVVDAFQRRHPDIKVRTLLSGPDALQHVSIYCAGGKCPDVLMAW